MLHNGRGIPWLWMEFGTPFVRIYFDGVVLSENTYRKFFSTLAVDPRTAAYLVALERPERV